MSEFEGLSESDFEELKNVFYSQAHEAVDDLQDLLLALEAAPEDGATLKAIKRHVHTLKGDSNSIGLASVGSLCHSIEDIISSLIDGSRDLKHECIDLLLSSVDLLNRLLGESETGAPATETEGFMERIADFLKKDNGHRGENLRVSQAFAAEHAVSAEGCAKHETSPGPGLTEYQELQMREELRVKSQCAGTISLSARSEMVRIEASRVDKIMELTGELIIGRSMIDQAVKDLEDGASRDDIAARLFAANSYMERTVSDLQKGVMKMRMVPVSHVFRKFPKIVRDLCAEKGKMARLDMQGKETELDKGIVDALGEPLSHIVRNFIDHGIEEPAYRRSIGKPAEGVITLNAYHEAAQIVIEASDDGRGIDRERVRKKAVEKGLLTEDEGKKLSDHDAVNLIFLSGLSTSEALSETSGRGIGMDAVKSAVDAMKGSVEVASTQGKGTMFRLRLPLTLAVIRGLLFEVGRKLYAVPVSAVADVTRIATADLVTVGGKDTFLLRDRIISVIRLDELFNGDRESGERKFILTIGIGNKKMGVLVDRIKGQQELVIKAVDDGYMRSGLVTGASILGDGRVVLILDAPAMFRKAIDDEKKRTVTA